MKKSMMILGVLFASAMAVASFPGYSEIKGTTTNYNVKNGDGWVDFSLVIPAMTSEELLNFDLSKIISPETDEIKALGQSLKVPSNMSAPKQTESYFLSFTIEKPVFRNYLPDNAMFNLYALRGRFPVKDVIKGVQAKKSVFELINFFEFEGGGTKNVKSGTTTNISIPVDSVTLDKEFSVKAPKYSAGKVMLALSLFKTGGEYYPADVKRVLAGATEKLRTKSGVGQFNLSVLMNEGQRSFEDGYADENGGDIARGIFGSMSDRADDMVQLSYTLQKATATTSPQLLAHIAAPKFNKGQSKVTADAPKAVSGMVPYAVHLVLSEVQPASATGAAVDFKKPLWTHEVMSWEENFAIPSAAMNMIKNKQYSWDIMYLGADSQESDTAINWDKVTHATRHSVSF